ncbi:MAG: VWA domain-containing protein, partial [Promethearchaeota archaeon]
MFKKSFKRLVKKPTEKLEDMPLIAALTIEKLEENVEETTIKPLVCKHCGGILTVYSKLQKKEESLYSWVCEFCGNENEIKVIKIEEKEEIEKKKGITTEELSIIFKEITEEQEKKEEGKNKEDKKVYGETLVAVIDISGSMSSGKLDAVKHSLVQTVKDIKVNTPDTVFSLIEFTDHVGLIPVPHNTIKIDDDRSLFSKKEMKKTLQKELKNVKIGPVGEFGDKWVKKIESLRTAGWTALGPGLYSGVVLIQEKILAKNAKGARIILLT